MLENTRMLAHGARFIRTSRVKTLAVQEDQTIHLMEIAYHIVDSVGKTADSRSLKILHNDSFPTAARVSDLTTYLPGQASSRWVATR